MKFKANNGDCEVTVNARLVYNNDFKNKGIVKIWYDVFVKRMYLAEIVSKRKEYLRICTRLMEAMKTYLKLKTYLPEPEGQKFWLNEDYE